MSLRVKNVMHKRIWLQNGSLELDVAESKLLQNSGKPALCITRASFCQPQRSRTGWTA
jgi:hypothetical protein